MIGDIFHIIFYQPLHNILVFLTGILPFHDLGLAIIILTVAVRFIIFPFSHKSVVTQRKIKEIEPEISKIKEKLKDNRQEQTKQIMDLYRKHGISPFSGFLMLLIQFPIFIALFILLKKGVDLDGDVLYSFVKLPEKINTIFLGFIDLSKSKYLLSILAGLSQFFQIRLAMPKTKKPQTKDHSFKGELQRSMSLQMKYIMPVIIFFIAQRFSSGLALYWTISNVFAILHEIVVAKKAKKISAQGGLASGQKDNERTN
ncbi:YidC/Oxa1 family membrane protein insertase [Patescibacteria group bacterium]